MTRTLADLELPVHTERVVLRRLAATDAAQVFSYRRDPAVARGRRHSAGC